MAAPQERSFSHGQPDKDEEVGPREANDRLFRLFHTPRTRGNDILQAQANERVIRAIQGYYSFTIQAAYHGFSEASRKDFVKDRLSSEGLLCAPGIDEEIQFEIVSDAYEKNSGLWDAQLGQRRKMRNDMIILFDEGFLK